MTLKVLELDKEKTLWLKIEYDLPLEDEQQLVVKTFEYERGAPLGSGGYAFTRKEPKKYVLKKLQYEVDDNQFSLHRITVLGFRKDKKIRAKEEWITNSETGWWYPKEQFDEIVAQIPDHFHDKARQAFSEMTTQLQNDLNEMTKNGVKIK